MMERKKRRQLPPRLSLSAGFTWMGRVIWKGGGGEGGEERKSDREVIKRRRLVATTRERERGHKTTRCQGPLAHTNGRLIKVPSAPPRGEETKKHRHAANWTWSWFCCRLFGVSRPHMEQGKVHVRVYVRVSVCMCVCVSVHPFVARLQ